MGNENGNKLEYDVQQRARAGTKATFRGVVALYIIYLGYSVIRSAGDEASTMPPWLAWGGGILLIAAALGFGVYTWKRWRLDVEAARIREDAGIDTAGEDAPEQ